MNTYDQISMEVSFSRWYIDHDMGDKKDGYVRAKWNIILRCNDRMMAVEFNTGFRDLIGPYNLTRIVQGGQSFALYSKTRKPVTDQQTLIHCEKAVRAFVSGKATGHNEWLTGLVKHLSLKEPTKFDVMSCLCSDAQTLESARNFEEWASDLGMDSDSRKAEKIYRATQDQTQMLRNLVHGASLEKLCEFVRNIDSEGEEEARAQYAQQQVKDVNIDELELRVHAARNEADRLLQEAARAVLKDGFSLHTAIAAMGALSFYDKAGAVQDLDNWAEEPSVKHFNKLAQKYQEMFGPTWGPWRLNKQADHNITVEIDW